MNAKDVMTCPVVTVGRNAEVTEIARLLLERRISAVPVVDANGAIAGIVSEGDLIHHEGSGTAGPRAWWLRWFQSPEARAREYVKSHGRFADEVMTANVVTVRENTPLPEIARLLEERRIKRVPVVDEGGKLVGIVSRANLLRGFAASAPPPAGANDESLRIEIQDRLRRAGVRSDFLNVIVAGGKVDIWGVVESEAERDAVRTLLENLPDQVEVGCHVTRLEGALRSVLGAE